MKLKELLTGISVLECTADPELEIKEIFYDSRKVTPGSLFVAVSGFAADGNKFIPMAAEKGAAAVVTAKKPEGDIPAARCSGIYFCFFSSCSTCFLRTRLMYCDSGRQSSSAFSRSFSSRSLSIVMLILSFNGFMFHHPEDSIAFYRIFY